jgi:hypothetical protein
MNSPLMRPTSCSMVLLSSSYSGMSTRLGTTTWMSEMRPAQVRAAMQQVVERLEPVRMPLV